MRPLELRSVLVASDLTASSDDVVRAGAAFAELTSSTLHVLHAIDFQVPPYIEAGLVEASLGSRIGECEGALRDQISRAVPRRVVAESRVMVGSPHHLVQEEIERTGAGLVVLGPHRKLPMGDGLLGTTADRLIRTLDVPCLVMRGTLALPLRSVVAPLDLSEPARGALDLAVAWCVGLGRSSDGPGLSPLELRVLHVIPRVFELPDFPFDRAVIGPELHREISASLQRVEGGNSLEAREEVVWGDDPADEIVAYAERENADLIVMGTHGYGSVRRALVGSVASRVARRAKTPVLLVPPTLWRAREGESAAHAEPAAPASTSGSGPV